MLPSQLYVLSQSSTIVPCSWSGHSDRFPRRNLTNRISLCYVLSVHPLEVLILCRAWDSLTTFSNRFWFVVACQILSVHLHEVRLNPSSSVRKVMIPHLVDFSLCVRFSVCVCMRFKLILRLVLDVFESAFCVSILSCVQQGNVIQVLMLRFAKGEFSYTTSSDFGQVLTFQLELDMFFFSSGVG